MLGIRLAINRIFRRILAILIVPSWQVNIATVSMVVVDHPPLPTQPGVTTVSDTIIITS